jgi:hypothetical protein
LPYGREHCPHRRSIFEWLQGLMSLPFAKWFEDSRNIVTSIEFHIF